MQGICEKGRLPKFGKKLMTIFSSGQMDAQIQML